MGGSNTKEEQEDLNKLEEESLNESFKQNWTKEAEKVNPDDIILNQVKELCPDGTKPTFLLIGPSGSGKSTLVNRIFGKALAEVGAGRPITQNFTVYDDDTSLIRLVDWKGYETNKTDLWKSETQEIVKEQKIHAIWYFVNAAARWQDFDSELCDVLIEIPKFYLITKIDTVQESEVIAIEQAIRKDRELKPDFKGVYKSGKWEPTAPKVCPDCECSQMMIDHNEKTWVCAKGNHQGIFTKKMDDMESLVNKLEEILPEENKNAFNAAQVVDPSKKIPILVGVIVSYTASAGGVAFSPLPFSDILLLAPIQTGMLFSLAYILGVPLHKYPRVVALQGGLQTVVSLSGMGLSNLLKSFFPGIGTIASSIINATIATTLTAAFGILYVVTLFQIREHMDIVDRYIIPEELIKLMFNKNVSPGSVKNICSDIKGSMSSNMNKTITESITKRTSKKKQ